MNAVERLLTHGEQLLSLFDEMYRERIGSGRDPTLPDVPIMLIYRVGGDVIDAMPRGEYWASGHWMQAAIEVAWHDLQPNKRKPQPSIEEFAARAAEVFRDYLSQREQLLSRDTWRRLLADVVFESREWERLSPKVVSLSEQVAREVQRVGRVSSGIEPLDWQRRKRVRLRKALDLLHPYAQPPKARGSSPMPRSSRRPAAGGRPKKYSDELRHAIIADRKQEDRKKNPQPLKTWLTSWATAHDMKRADALKMYNAEMAAIRRAQQARSR